MNKILILLILNVLLLTVKAQNKEVEIYVVQSNTIVKGIIEANNGDSLYLKADSLHTLAFAKSELEGIDLPVSKEVKKLRRKLISNESYRTFRLFPGIYQMRNGEKVKGKIIFALASIGVLTFITSGGIFIVGLATLKGIDLLVAALEAFFVFAPAFAFWGTAKTWNDIDQIQHIKKKVYNRYYYTGENLKLNISFQ